MQKSCSRRLKSVTALAAALALTVSGLTVTDASAASNNAPTLSKTKISLKKGKSQVVKIVKNKKVTVKKVTWSIKSGAKVVKLTNKSKTQVKINALKKGTATVVAKINVKSKTYTRNVKVTVTAANNNNTNTPAPDKTETPSVSDAPVVTDTPSEPGKTDAPSVSDEPSVSDAPSVSDQPQETTAAKPTATPKKTYVTNQPDPTLAPDGLGGTLVEKSSWNKGQIPGLSALYAGKKVRVTFQVRIRGAAEEALTGKNMTLQSNYNGYPTFATIPLSTEWTDVSFVHRFNEFTNKYPAMYITGNDVTDNMMIYYQNVQFEVLDEGDPLGGDAIAPNQWNMVTIKSLREGTGATPQKFYENKTVHVSFKLRQKGMESPGTVDIQENVASGYPNVKENVPLTEDWTEVEFDYTFGEITNEYPSLYFGYNKATFEAQGIEFFMKDFSITVTGTASTPSPAPTATPAGPADPDATPTPAPTDLVLQGSDLGAGASYTYVAAGAAQYETVAQLALSGDKFTSDPTILLEWEAKDKENNNITASTEFNITIRKDNAKWQEDGKNDLKTAYDKKTTCSVQIGTDAASLTASNTIYIIIATKAAGFNGTFTLKKASLDSTDIDAADMPADYTYQENGAAQYAVTAKVNLPAGINLSNYKTCEVEYNVANSSVTQMYVEMHGKIEGADKKDVSYSASNGKFTITLSNLK